MKLTESAIQWPIKNSWLFTLQENVFHWRIIKSVKALVDPAVIKQQFLGLCVAQCVQEHYRLAAARKRDQKPESHQPDRTLNSLCDFLFYSFLLVSFSVSVALQSIHLATLAPRSCLGPRPQQEPPAWACSSQHRCTWESTDRHCQTWWPW